MKDYTALLELFLSHLQNYRTGLPARQPKELYEPGDYILSLGGKRLRPLLALIACDLFDKDPQLAINSALSVELFHNFSLVHDDILDAAPLRRNKETVHKKWNTNIAILSGDVMLVKSFQVLENYGFKEFKKLSALFSKTAIEVCEGQQLDMNFESAKAVTASEYIDMITFKTAVLLGCSLKMGAINAYASDDDQHKLYEFGKHLGIAFQLLDDMLDAYSEDPESFGKQTGGDIIANKKTFLLVKAMELADAKQKKEINKLLKLKQKDADQKVSGMLDLYNALNIKDLCIAEADRHTALAIEFLNKTGASATKKQKLEAFALELLNRQV